MSFLPKYVPQDRLKYLTPKSDKFPEGYVYTGEDHSILKKLFLGKWWDLAVLAFPTWVAYVSCYKGQKSQSRTQINHLVKLAALASIALVYSNLLLLLLICIKYARAPENYLSKLSLWPSAFNTMILNPTSLPLFESNPILLLFFVSALGPTWCASLVPLLSPCQTLSRYLLQLTLLGFFCLLSNYLLATVICPAVVGCDEEPPRWLFYWTAISLFLYQTLDNIDGKQVCLFKFSYLIQPFLSSSYRLVERAALLPLVSCSITELTRSSFW